MSSSTKTFKFYATPIEKWCSNCDYDCETYEKIPHTRKYRKFIFLMIELAKLDNDELVYGTYEEVEAYAEEKIHGY